MSALDQAFIKAYMQQESGTAIASWSVSTEPRWDARAEVRSRGDEAGHEMTADSLPSDSAATAVAEPETSAVAVAEEEPPPAADDGQFRAMLQVDGLAWPSSVTKMAFAAEEALGPLVERLVRSLQKGSKAVAFQGCRRGDGCTTVLLAVALQLARRGLKPVVLDADCDHPRLARRLGLAPEAGWEAVLAGRLPLAEVVVQSLEEGLAIVPFCEPSAEEERALASGADLGPMIEVLRAAYDVVLVDLGRPDKRCRINPGEPSAAGGWLHTLLVVRNLQATAEGEAASVCEPFVEGGVAEVGVIENFA
jgi:Mrp family chromosome partitioning ATPase